MVKSEPSIAEVHYSIPGSLELSTGVVPLGFGTINGRLGRQTNWAAHEKLEAWLGKDSGRLVQQSSWAWVQVFVSCSKRSELNPQELGSIVQAWLFRIDSTCLQKLF